MSAQHKYSPLGPEPTPGRTTKTVAIASVVLLAVVGSAMLLSTGSPAGTEANQGHDHHQHDHHQHGHHDHDHHDHRRGQHVCIHDKIQHPPLVRNYARVVDVDSVTPVINSSFVGASSDRRVTVNDGSGSAQTVAAWGGNPDSPDATDGIYSEGTCTSNAGNTKQAIRIQLVDGGISSLSSDSQTYLTSMLTKVVTYFQSTLTVVRLTGTLNCEQSGTGVVDGVDLGTTCSTTGYANTDFVLFYAASDSTTCSSNTDTLAYAAPLEIMSCDRPVVGYIHFCASRLTSTDTSSTQHDLQYSTALHEVIHALGFTSRLFAYYRDSSGASRTTRDGDGAPANTGSTTQTVTLSTDGTTSTGTFKIYQPASSYMTTTTDATLGRDVTKFTTGMSTLSAKARDHFGCTTLDGVELENQGGSESWGSHWEKRIFGDELMTAVVTGVDSPLSDVTLGFLADTGFYDVSSYTAAYDGDGDLSQGAQDNLWLSNAGCSAVTSKCISTSGSTSTPVANVFCTESSSTEMCTYDRKAKGSCNKGTQAANYAASFYQYFGDTTTYGGVAVADYCPIVQKASNRICTNTADATLEGSTVAAMGQAYGADSRCFTSSLWNPSAGTQQTKTAGCYAYECMSASKVAITATYNSVNYVVACTTSGATIEITGWQGQLTCPDPSDKAVCGNTATFLALSALSLSSGGTSLDSSLIPTFADYRTSYRLNVGNSVSTLSVGPSASGVTITVDGTATTSGATHSVALSVGSNNVNVVTTSGSTTKTYALTVIRGDGVETVGIAVTLTLNMNYNTIGAVASFLDEVKTELTTLLNVNANQITMYQAVAGSVITRFTFNDDTTSSTAPSASSLDATFLSLFSDKGSTMFLDSGTYPKLSTATALTSGVHVACASSCTSTNCNPSTGVCTDDSDDSSFIDDYPYLVYGGAALVLILAIFLVYCIIKACCCSNKTAASTKSSAAFEAPERNPKPERKPKTTAAQASFSAPTRGIKHVELDESEEVVVEMQPQGTQQVPETLPARRSLHPGLNDEVQRGRRFARESDGDDTDTSKSQSDEEDERQI